MKRTQIKRLERQWVRDGHVSMTDFAVELLNLTLAELLEEARVIRKNFKSGTALGMLETVERKIRARRVP